MSSTPDYGKWIRDALAANPKLSKAGLSRHLQHGLDRSRVLKMIDGRRRIQIDELPAIAAYLGVPPPSLPVAVSELAGIAVPRIGQIAPGVWMETDVNLETEPSAVQVPSCLDPRYPPDRQGYYDLRIAIPEAGLLSGDCLLSVSIRDAKPRPFGGDLVVIIRERSGLKQFGLARAEPDGRTFKSLTKPPSSGETIKPIAVVIGVYRTY